MRQFGISPETFLFKDEVIIGYDKDNNPITKVGDYIPKEDEIKTCSGAVYKKDPDALMPAILTHYYALRKAAKVDKKTANTEYEELKVILERRKGL